MPTSSNRDNLPDRDGSSSNLPLLSDVQAQSAATFRIVCHDPQNPAQVCPICGGLGVIKYDVPVHDERFGKLFRCPNRPAQADKEHVERLKKISNLGAFADKTLENFMTKRHGYSPYENNALQIAYDNALRFAQNPKGWLFLQGGFGCGKTHLAAAIGNARISLGEAVVFITVPDLLDHLRQSYQADGGDSYSASFDRLRSVSLLILDDLGTENQSDWAKEKLFQLLNHRYTHRLPTVITSNANPDSFEARLKSRLSDTQLVNLHIVQAPDFRSEANKDNRKPDPFSRLSTFRYMNFGTFDFHSKLLPEERENLTVVTNAAFEYAQQGRGWLLVMGRYGTGKTHLAASIGNYWQEQGYKVMLITLPDLMDYLRMTFDQHNDISFHALFDAIKTTPYLILDDLGTESSSAWVQEKLFQLLDYRYIENLPTVFTTPKAKIEDLNERIANRMLDKRMCRILAIKLNVAYAKRMGR